MGQAFCGRAGAMREFDGMDALSRRHRNVPSSWSLKSPEKEERSMAEK